MSNSLARSAEGLSLPSGLDSLALREVSCSKDAGAQATEEHEKQWPVEVCGEHVEGLRGGGPHEEDVEADTEDEGCGLDDRGGCVDVCEALDRLVVRDHLNVGHPLHTEE